MAPPWALAAALLALVACAGGAGPLECGALRRRVLVQVGLDGAPAAVAAGGAEGGPPCQVAWLGHAEASAPGAMEAALGAFDFVLTDSLELVAFGSRGGPDGRLLFLERVGQLLLEGDMDEALASKEKLLSVLLPAEGSAAWEDPRTWEVLRQAELLLPNDTFFDDGTAATHDRAFSHYRFSLIADDEAHTVSEAFVRCIGFQTIPLFNGFVNLGVMTRRAIIPWNRTHFGLDLLRSHLGQQVNHDIGWLWSYHSMLRDHFLYRYGRPFEERLRSAACALCRTAAGPPPQTGPTRAAAPVPLASACVFSAKGNAERRQAIRDTWGRVLSEAHGVRVRFFLGEVGDHDDAIRAESEAHGDVVVLGVPEGYEMNSRKGLLLLEWAAKNALAEFLLKIDDDVYLRPDPVLAVLRRRPPFGYAWGYFDYLSPVPREPGSHFYSSLEAYPFDAFPPYPRGLVRALSMDVVRAVAAQSASTGLRMIFGDDPCLGVHLRLALVGEEALLPMLAMDDRDSYRAFAMEPSCSLSLWSVVTPRTWAAHHVTGEEVRCMWAADVAAGYYLLEGGSVRPSDGAAAAARAASEVALATAGRPAPEVPPLPDLCHCLLSGPLAAALANRTDRINASRTHEIFGDPNSDVD